MATVKLKRRPIEDVDEEVVIKPNRSPVDTDIEARDIISSLVGKGYTSLSDEDARNSYNRLRVIYGQPKAQKLLEQISIYNQRPELRNLPLEERISKFYTIGSSNPAANEIISKAGKLGYGVLPGFRESPYVPNQQLQGLTPDVVAAAPMAEEVKKKVLLRLGK